MNLEAIKWAREYRAKSPAEMAVLWAIATRVDERGECYPSIKRLALDAAVSERTVCRILSELEDRGVIERLHRERPIYSEREQSRLTVLAPIALPDYPGELEQVRASERLRSALKRDPWTVERRKWSWEQGANP